MKHLNRCASYNYNIKIFYSITNTLGRSKNPSTKFINNKWLPHIHKQMVYLLNATADAAWDDTSVRKFFHSRGIYTASLPETVGEPSCVSPWCWRRRRLSHSRGVGTWTHNMQSTLVCSNSFKILHFVKSIICSVLKQLNNF